MVVSRLVDHKKIDLAIHTCHHLNKKLIIVGEGRSKNKLASLTKKLNTS
ncbi:MAG: glycosyltransferase family 4 protein, partial [Bacilli bacterium]|nr:glycosyltransferase family 4 protein [Bacilli bacterium]